MTFLEDRKPGRLSMHSQLITYFEVNGGSVFEERSSKPNTDNDVVFGDTVYVSFRRGEGAIPAYDYTEPVACSTSMAVAKTLMKGKGNYFIVPLLKSDMPKEALGRVREVDKMLAHPVIGPMLRKHQEKAHLREQKRSKQRAKKHSRKHP